jgi:phosphoribosylamine--glycine ligase
MKVLIIGSGGREDAFVWKFNQEGCVEKIYVSPGHGGMKRFSKVDVLGKLSQNEVVAFACDQGIDLVVIGPEAPLISGLADDLRDKGILVLGPSAKASQLEGSKIFSKKFMKRHAIATADFEVFNSYEDALVGLKKWPVEDEGVVIKADGLAGGKGVVVTWDRLHAEKTLHDFMVNPDIQVKTSEILMETVLPGEEVSVFVLAHALDYLYLGAACDHKRLLDGDQGPNTGGMGCFYDPQWPDSSLKEKIEERIVKPTLKGMAEEGQPYTGFLFLGLMIDENNDPYVVEYNVRFGDPETQTLMPVLEGDFSSFLYDFLQGKNPKPLRLKEEASVHVVATSAGYPALDSSPMDLGHRIVVSDPHLETGHLDQGATLFYAGVATYPSERGLINTGGRVLGVTALSKDHEVARKLAYQGLEKIQFKGMHFRKDIGLRKRGQGNP